MALPLQSAVIKIGKDSNLNFFKKIQIYPHKQHYQNARFRQISTAKFTTWYMDSAIKMVFYRKSKASPIVL